VIEILQLIDGVNNIVDSRFGTGNPILTGAAFTQTSAAALNGLFNAAAVVAGTFGSTSIAQIRAAMAPITTPLTGTSLAAGVLFDLASVEAAYLSGNQQALGDAIAVFAAGIAGIGLGIALAPAGTPLVLAGSLGYIAGKGALFVLEALGIDLGSWFATAVPGDFGQSTFDMFFPDSGSLAVDPLVLDLDGNGVDLIGASQSSVYFDFDGDGFRENTGWVGPNDGMLVRDLNANGTIDTLHELISTAGQDAYSVLRQHDTNSDGKVTSQDSIWASLKVWQDANSNGVTDVGELKLLSILGITEFNLSNSLLGANADGNSVHSQSTFTINGQTKASQAVFFGTARNEAIFEPPAGYQRNTETFDLPDLSGGGATPPLSYSMTSNAALLTAVKNLVNSSSTATISNMRTAIEEIVFKWTGAENAVAGSRGQFIDARHLGVLEAMGGRNYPVTSVNPTEAMRLESSYQNLLDGIAARFIAQSYNSFIQLNGSNSPAAQNHGFKYLKDVFVDPTFNSVVVDRAAFVKSILDDAASLAVDAIQLLRTGATNLALSNSLSILQQFVGRDTKANEAFADKVYSFLPGLNAQQLSAASVLANLIGGGSFGDFVYGTTNADTLTANPALRGLVGAEGNDSLTGNSNANLLIGGIGSDTLTGSGGNDTYIYNNGDGADTIFETGLLEGTADKLQFTGHSFAELRVTRSLTNNDLVLTFTNNTDQITIKDGALVEYDKGVDVFGFTGGISKTIAELRTIAITQKQTTAADTLKGFDYWNDTFTGGTGADTITGLSGNDTYIYNNGDGADTILETGLLEGTADKLQFTGHSFAELRVTRSLTNNDLVLTFTNNTDQVTIKDGALVGYDKGIEQFAFTGAVNKTIADLRTLAITQKQTTAADTLKGFDYWDDTFTGGNGNDAMTGLSGNDTYVYNNGNGADTIFEIGLLEGTADKLHFTGHSFAELRVTRSLTNNDLVLTFTNNTDQVTIKDGALVEYDKGIEQFLFTGAVTKTIGELRALSITQKQTTAADTLKGFDYWNDTFTGGNGNDTMTGLSGNDTYIYNNGNGADTIFETGLLEGTADKLQFTGHSFAELRATRSLTNDDLVLTFTNNTDQVTIKNGALVEFDKGIEQFLFTGAVTKTVGDLRALSITQKQTTAADILKGYANWNDTFTGGAGNDAITGLSGNDTFVFATGFGLDTVTDFTAGAGVGDVLRISHGTSFNTYAEVYAAAAQSGANTIITFNATTKITLNNVTKTNLVEDDFAFF
jgi:Ca2+-binding RTX toxin-like protein